MENCSKADDGNVVGEWYSRKHLNSLALVKEIFGIKKGMKIVQEITDFVQENFCTILQTLHNNWW